MTTGGAYAQGKDMLLLPDGSTYHLGVKKGDVFQRIVTVGSHSRAKAIASVLDKDKPCKEMTSTRGFTVYTGYYKGTGVTIIAIGMGAPMMDFMVREVSFVVPGPLAIVRLGTCGLFNPDLKPSTIVTAGKGSMYSYVNYCHWTGHVDGVKPIEQPPYLLCKPVPCTKELNQLVVKHLKESGCTTVDGLNSCGETFYSCQGRKSTGFKDENETVVEQMLKEGVDFMEMETHQLFFLGSIREQPLYTAAAAIGIVNRTNEAITGNITTDDLHRLEIVGGEACLKALVDFKLE